MHEQTFLEEENTPHTLAFLVESEQLICIMESASLKVTYCCIRITTAGVLISETVV
jgi:hypothetical protein